VSKITAIGELVWIDTFKTKEESTRAYDAATWRFATRNET
jgi:hypothetical protein